MNQETELTMRESQLAALNVLVKIKEIFDAHNWKYYLAYGTLLGAIRHNGFIPWDDDIDIWVPRNDYEAFLTYYKEHKEEFEHLELFHYSTSEKYLYPIARLSDNRYKTVFFDQKEYGIGSFVDIYPLDGINPSDKRFIKKLYHKTLVISMMGYKDFLPSKNKIVNIFKYLYWSLLKNKPSTKKLKEIDLKARKYAFGSTEYFGNVNWEPRTCYKMSYLGNGINHVFEGVEFRIPEHYDELMKQEYGDYMKLPPVEEQVGHHFYKVYKK